MKLPRNANMVVLIAARTATGNILPAAARVIFTVVPVGQYDVGKGGQTAGDPYKHFNPFPSVGLV